MKKGQRTRKLALTYTALTALGTSLVFAYLVTEMQVRLFYNDSFALFAVASIALAGTYLLGYLRGRHSSEPSESSENDNPPSSDQ